MSDKYKMITDLGLEVRIGTREVTQGFKDKYDYVRAEDLKDLFEKNVMVLGVDGSYSIILNVKPIQKLEPVSKIELEILNFEIEKKFGETSWQREIIKRIKEVGIK